MISIDLYPRFLNELTARARSAGLADRIEVRCMDMRDLPKVFRELDLIWSEGSAYNMGFGNALATWSSALAAGGLVVASELSWLKPDAPEEARAFFRSAYPEMKSRTENVAVAAAAGYRVLATHVVSERGWIDDYYAILRPRAEALRDHPNAIVRQRAAETVREIEVFERAEGSYGYVFYVLQRRAEGREGAPS